MRRGVGLLECVVGLFLLTAGILSLFQLFHVALQHQSKTEMQYRAAHAGECLLEEVAGWASEPTNFATAWAVWHDQFFSRPEAPGLWFQVKVVRQATDIYTPASGLEKVYGSEARKLSRSLVQVWVEAGREPQRGKVLWRFHRRVSEPRREAGAINLRFVKGASQISRDQSATLEAELLDSVGQVIPDVTFYWELKPVTGNGLLKPNGRDGHQIEVTHHYIAPIPYVDGQAILQVHCRYFGKEVSNEVALLLQP